MLHVVVTEVCLFYVAVRPSGPVHSGKKRSSEVVPSYEKVPRKLARMEEKEVIHLLPIKDKTGVIPQSIERGRTHSIDLLIDLISYTGNERVNFTSVVFIVIKQPPEEQDEEEEEAANESEEFEHGMNDL